MTDQRDRVVRRVVHALDDEQRPDALVWDHFDADRTALVDAARQTLQATGDARPFAEVAETVDRELLESLRFPAEPRGGLLPALYVRRGRVGAALIALLTVLAAVLL